MTYYHQGRPEVLDAWRKTQTCVANYADCAQEWYTSHENAFVEPALIEGACKQQRDALKEQLGQLTITLQQARRYLWSESELSENTESNSDSRK